MNSRIKHSIGYTGAVLAALTLGAVVGSSDPTTSTEYTQLAAERDDLTTERDGMADENRDLLADVESLTEEVATIEDREAEVQKIADDLDQLASSLKRQAVSLTKREKAVGIIEAEIERNTISDGSYQAGKHIKAGTYRTKGSPRGCYWAVNADPNGRSILSNSYGDGPTSVTIAAGQWLELSGCGELVLQTP